MCSKTDQVCGASHKQSQHIQMLSLRLETQSLQIILVANYFGCCNRSLFYNTDHMGIF